MASADWIASKTRRGSTASMSSRLKWRGSDTGLLPDRREGLEEVHRLLSAGDRELKDQVVHAQLGGLAKIGHHLGAQAPERRAAGRLELACLPPLLRLRLG